MTISGELVLLSEEEGVEGITVKISPCQSAPASKSLHGEQINGLSCLTPITGLFIHPFSLGGNTFRGDGEQIEQQIESTLFALEDLLKCVPFGVLAFLGLACTLTGLSGCRLVHLVFVSGGGNLRNLYFDGESVCWTIHLVGVLSTVRLSCMCLSEYLNFGIDSSLMVARDLAHFFFVDDAFKLDVDLLRDLLFETTARSHLLKRCSAFLRSSIKRAFVLSSDNRLRSSQLSCSSMVLYFGCTGVLQVPGIGLNGDIRVLFEEDVDDVLSRICSSPRLFLPLPCLCFPILLGLDSFLLLFCLIYCRSRAGDPIKSHQELLLLVASFVSLSPKLMK